MIAETGGPAIFAEDNTGDDALWQGLGFLASKVSWTILTSLNPTLNFQTNDVLSLPINLSDTSDAAEVTKLATALGKKDWDYFETSWDFTALPLLRSEFRSDMLLETYPHLRAQMQSMTEKMQQHKETNNRIFIEAYGLEDDLSPEVPLDEITLTCNPHYRYGSSNLKSRNWSALCDRFPAACERLDAIALEMSPETPEEDRLGLEQRLLEDTMKELISYAVGCMFGRYSLDKPGLILANQGESVDSYQLSVAREQLSEEQKPLTTDHRPLTTAHRPLTTAHRPLTTEISFMPVEDNVIPMLDGDWFAGDITARFKRFLRVTFGEAHYAENLAFIELALNRDVRSYFLRNFYDDHVRTYSKRPIYWLFSSPSGSFNALVYMHRYRPDTVSIVLNDYLREFRTKLKAHRNHMAYVERSADTAQRDKTQAVKEIARIDKVLNELREYEDQVLFPLATRQVEIDLDDGVLVNYNKLGKALARVSGLSGKA